MSVGSSVAQVRDEQENNVAAGYPFDTMGISIDHGTDGLCIFTNLEHFSAGIPKIDCSIPRDSIADLANLEIIVEAVVLVRNLKFLVADTGSQRRVFQSHSMWRFSCR